MPPRVYVFPAFVFAVNLLNHIGRKACKWALHQSCTEQGQAYPMRCIAVRLLYNHNKEASLSYD